MKKTLILMVLLGLTTAVFAQVNFPGSYKLKTKTHVAGPQYGNALASELRVLQGKDSLIVESVSPGAVGAAVKGRSAFAMDGKKTTVNSVKSKRKFVRSLAWLPDGKSLKLTTVFYVAEQPSEVDFTREEVWSLSPDGKELVLQKKSTETRSENWEVKGVYSKE